jgi:hypothetical protein
MLNVTLMKLMGKLQSFEINTNQFDQFLNKILAAHQYMEPTSTILDSSFKNLELKYIAN